MEEKEQSMIMASVIGREMTRTTWTVEEQRSLRERAYAGDKSVFPELRAMLDAHPDIVRAEGDLVHMAHRTMIAAVADGDSALVEVLSRRAMQIQAALAGQHPTALERLLCERIATCWLAVYLLDAASIKTADGQQAPESMIEQHERMKDIAHKRYLEACTALARVRRLLAPVINQQINIAASGAHQMNIGETFTAPHVAESLGPPERPTT